MSIFYINIPLGVLLITQAPFIWPGINLVEGMLITTVVLVAPALMYSFLAGTMPRAGGDYVYVSRVVHPAFGFIIGGAFALVLSLAAGVFAAWIASVGLSPTLAALGVVLKDSSLTTASTNLSGHGWEFGIGAVAILVAGGLNLFGWRVILPVMRIMFAVIVIGLLLSVVLMIGTTRTSFTHIFSHYGSYSGVIASAQHHGYAARPSNSISHLLLFIALGFTDIGLFMLPALTAGEIKRPARGVTTAVVGSLVVAGLAIALMSGLAYRTFGSSFLGAMTYLSTNVPSAYPHLPPPFFFQYAMMLTGNVPVLIIMSVGFVLAVFTGMFVLWLATTRFILAFSLDRILPDWLAEVNPRFHTPARINALVTLFALIVLAVYVYGHTSFFGFIYSVELLQAVIFCGTSLAAILLPFRAPGLFKASPFKKTIGGVPLISVLGAISLVEYIYFAVVLATNNAIGANATSGLIAIAIVGGVTIPIYVVSYVIRRAHGVDLFAAFRELPPE
jgi:amino acid transporter